MPLQFWRNLGYFLCLIGLWFQTPALDFCDEIKLIVAFVTFWGGVVSLALALFFDWIDQSDTNDKK